MAVNAGSEAQNHLVVSQVNCKGVYSAEGKDDDLDHLKPKTLHRKTISCGGKNNIYSNIYQSFNVFMIITLVGQQLRGASHGMILYKVQHTNEMTQQ